MYIMIIFAIIFCTYLDNHIVAFLTLTLSTIQY